ncbi:MAG: hypothetical protein AYL33_004520 [Candidatus Bathyarchaeota archaeon B63]|nr:MAG: hypothetical protein AYL33_004520 [Candidatus Bathyarchaeota archaeon B63]
MMDYHNHGHAGSTWGIIAGSLSLYSRGFNLLFFPFLTVGLINTVLWKLALDMIPPFVMEPGFTEDFLIRLIDYLTFTTPIVMIFSVISLVIEAIPSGLIVKYASDIIEGKPAGLRSSLDAAASKAIYLLSAALIRDLLVVLGLFLFIIPGIIIAVLFSLATQLIMIEGRGVYGSLRRSKEMAMRRPWQAFSILLFIAVLVVLGAAIAEMISSDLMVTGYIRLFIINTAISLVKPLQPIALTHLYYSLRAEEGLAAAYRPYRPGFPAAGYHPRFCYKCGQRLPSDAVYCPRCGVRVRTQHQASLRW